MLSEEKIEELEQTFPEMAAVAFATARAEALASGLSVVEVQGSTLWEVFPDGTRRAIKAIEPRTAVVPGTTLTIA